MVLCASPDYWQKNGKPTEPSQLKDHNCFLYSYRTSPREWRFCTGPTEEQGYISVRVSGSLIGNNGELSVAVLKAGIGVSILPAFMICDELSSGELEPALQSYMEPALNIYAVYPHARHLSPKVRVFVDFLAETFKVDGHWGE